MRCIIADDHPLFRAALTQLIESEGLASDVATVDDVAGLYAAVESTGAPDLLLLDLHIPGASGFSALSWFVGNYPREAVVMISANTHPDTVRRAIDHGAAAFLSKSADTAVMRECLQRVRAGERGLHPGLEMGNSGASLQALDIADALATLTPQQFRVASMLVEGLLNKQIGYELGVKEATIKAHMTEIFRKLGVQSRTQAVLAIGNLTVTPPQALEKPPPGH
jgi:DNA-binding NarL/FixJ family response regulator